MKYSKRLLIAIDQLANVLVFDGWPDETVSARAWRQQQDPFWNKMRVAIDRIFFWQTSHCYESYLWETTRRDLPEDY